MSISKPITFTGGPLSASAAVDAPAAGRNKAKKKKLAEGDPLIDPALAEGRTIGKTAKILREKSRLAPKSKDHMRRPQGHAEAAVTIKRRAVSMSGERALPSAAILEREVRALVNSHFASAKRRLPRFLDRNYRSFRPVFARNARLALDLPVGLRNGASWIWHKAGGRDFFDDDLLRR